MLDAITDAVADLTRLRLDAGQQRGVLAVLLLVLEADRVVRREETAWLERVAATCTALTEPARAKAIAEARLAARRVIDAGEVQGMRDLLLDARAAIRSQAACRAVYLLADRMANADREVAQGEIDALALVVETFRGKRDA